MTGADAARGVVETAVADPGERRLPVEARLIEAGELRCGDSVYLPFVGGELDRYVWRTVAKVISEQHAPTVMITAVEGPTYELKRTNLVSHVRHSEGAE